jgi:hypothetical protein
MLFLNILVVCNLLGYYGVMPYPCFLSKSLKHEGDLNEFFKIHTKNISTGYSGSASASFFNYGLSFLFPSHTMIKAIHSYSFYVNQTNQLGLLPSASKSVSFKSHIYSQYLILILRNHTLADS